MASLDFLLRSNLLLTSEHMMSVFNAKHKRRGNFIVYANILAETLFSSGFFLKNNIVALLLLFDN
jgi:hypothetical protein